MSEGLCDVCGSGAVVGWTYHCEPHDPRKARERIVMAFAAHVIEPRIDDDLAAFAQAMLPPGWDITGRRFVEALRAGNSARAIFDIGRLWERRNLDALCQTILESVPGATAGNASGNASSETNG